MACSLTTRAVKGGEAEAPDVSAPSLEGPGPHALITMEVAGRAPAGLDADFRPGDRSLPRLWGGGGPRRCGTNRCMCVSLCINPLS